MNNVNNVLPDMLENWAFLKLLVQSLWIFVCNKANIISKVMSVTDITPNACFSSIFSEWSELPSENNEFYLFVNQD